MFFSTSFAHRHKCYVLMLKFKKILTFIIMTLPLSSDNVSMLSFHVDSVTMASHCHMVVQHSLLVTWAT